MPINYTDKGPHLIEAITAAGHWLKNRDHVYISSDDVAVQAIIDAFDPLPDAKLDKIAELKREAAKRANSIYGFMSGEDEETEPSDVGAYVDLMIDLYTSIKANSREPLSGRLLEMSNLRTALNDATAAINALNDWEAVMAYDVLNTPSWP